MFPIRDHNPSGRLPVITLALIALNVAVFLATYPGATEWQLARTYILWGIVPARLEMGEGYLTLLTHMFLHGGWMHLAGNMLFLWIFGDNLEEALGSLAFLGFYALGGMAAAGLQWGADPGSMVPMVGASGAIAAVMGGYLLLFPRARVDVLVILLVFIRVFALPAWAVLGLWLGVQVFSGLALPTEGGGVAYWAHVGGFLAGLLLMAPVWIARGAGGWWRRTAGHPPHPPAEYPAERTRIPRVPRR